MDKAGRPPPPVLKRAGFQLDDQRFGVPGIDRVSGERLRQLITPGLLQLMSDREVAIEEAWKLFTKPFYAAQLRYYGVKFVSSDPVARLQAQFYDAIQQGLCDRVPETVVSLEAEMRRDYEPDLRRWEGAARAWDAEEEKRMDEVFAKCETPGQEAACDLTRFMNRYFLTDGEPDRDKTPGPMVLHGFHATWTLFPKVNRIPGLITADGGLYGHDRTVCIGWDSDAVVALARELTAQAYKALKGKSDAMWETAMEEHRTFVSHSSRGGGGQKKATPLTLGRLGGSYIVQCEAIADQWPDQITKVLTLDIAKRKYRGADMVAAAVNFEIFEGTMLLSLNPEAVGALATESEDNSEDASEDEDDGEASNNPRKRTAASSLPASQPEKKKQKSERPPRRAYLRFRGRETGEGGLLPDPEPGHIDFLDDECSTFEGVVENIEQIGEDIKFRGYKVSDLPRSKPEDWNSFSWEASWEDY